MAQTIHASAFPPSHDLTDANAGVPSREAMDCKESDWRTSIQSMTQRHVATPEQEYGRVSVYESSSVSMNTSILPVFSLLSIILNLLVTVRWESTAGPRDCAPDFWCMWLFWLCWLSSGNHNICSPTPLRGHCDGLRKKLYRPDAEESRCIMAWTSLLLPHACSPEDTLYFRKRS